MKSPSRLAWVYLQEMGLAVDVELAMNEGAVDGRILSIVARSERAAVGIEAEFEEMRRRRELSALNAEFQKERQRRRTEGLRGISLRGFEMGYKVRMMRTLCDALKQRKAGF